MSRYIDADLLKLETVYKNGIWDKITDSKGRSLSEIIDSIPTEQVVSAMWHVKAIANTKPIVRGEWIKHENPKGVFSLECSNCSCWFLREHLVRNTYCPNCGARMVEE